MRAHVLRALLRKEALRISSQRGTLGMALLMIVAAVLLSTLGTGALSSLGGASEVGLCVVDYWRADAWLGHLQEHRPADPSRRVEFRDLGAQGEGWIRYPTGSAGIQIRPRDPAPEAKVWVWHPGGNGSAAAWCEDWFWAESRRYFIELAERELPEASRARFSLDVAELEQVEPTSLRRESHERFREELGRALVRAGANDARARSVVPTLEIERSPLRSARKLGPEEASAMALTLLALLFVGVFLLPQVSCEERERGTLLAIALSPATGPEIVAARMLFYFAAAVALGVTVAGISAPAALLRPYLWLSIAVIAAGSVGVGMTIAALARTQRGAGIGAMLYLFATGVLLIAGKGGPLELITLFMLERHGPEMLLAAFAGKPRLLDWVVLGWTAGLALVWTLVASVAYRRSGWR